MFYIGIENYRKTCYVGLFEEEKYIPNTLEINIKIGKKSQNIEFLPDWDYSLISKCIEDVLISKDHHIFLEDILKDIMIQLRKTFIYDTIFVSIKKLNPPTNENLQSSYVEWHENI